jgi:GH18 family chitinase
LSAPKIVTKIIFDFVFTCTLHIPSSAMKFMKTYGFEGLDLDFEFPDTGDKNNFAIWVKELRSKLGSNYELTAAISAVESKIRHEIHQFD